MKTDLKQYKDTPYYLTSDGEVYRKYKHGYKRINGICQQVDNYKRIRVTIGRKKYELSRLVWETFVGEIPNGYIIEHRNGCTTMNNLTNLNLTKNASPRKYRKRKETHKIVDLLTRKIYRGTREAARELKHSRQTIRKVCTGGSLTRTKLEVAWWDDVNGRAFKGNYLKYYNKYMKDEIEA